MATAWQLIQAPACAVPRGTARGHSRCSTALTFTDKTESLPEATRSRRPGRFYDANNNLTSTLDALLKSDSSTFDARDRKIATTDRVLATTAFVYDAVSNLVSITDAQNGVTLYRYDARYLLDREVFPAGQAGRTARYYSYDAGRQADR